MEFDIIERLKDIRKSKKISVYRLSIMTGISQSTLANTFSRGMVPSIENLQKICEALDITLSEFFQESDKNKNVDSETIKIQHKYSLLSDTHKKGINKLIEYIVIFKIRGTSINYSKLGG